MAKQIKRVFQDDAGNVWVRDRVTGHPVCIGDREEAAAAGDLIHGLTMDADELNARAEREMELLVGDGSGEALPPFDTLNAGSERAGAAVVGGGVESDVDQAEYDGEDDGSDDRGDDDGEEDLPADPVGELAD